jgi:hypothetical protein
VLFALFIASQSAKSAFKSMKSAFCALQKHEKPLLCFAKARKAPLVLCKSKGTQTFGKARKARKHEKQPKAQASDTSMHDLIYLCSEMNHSISKTAETRTSAQTA